MKLVRASCIAVLLTASVPALASDLRTGLPPEIVQAPEVVAPEQLYVTLRGGFAAMPSTGYALDGALPGYPVINVNNSYRQGFTGSIGVGYEMGEIWRNFAGRFEFEAGYFQNQVAQHRLTTIAVANGPATVAAYGGTDMSGMTTGLYGMMSYFVDWRVGRLRPFLGAGIGLAFVNFERHGVRPYASAIMDDGDMSVAWHVSAGLGYELTRAVTIEMGYRYMRIDDVNLTTLDLGAPGQRITSTTAVQSHQLTLGARVRF